MVWPDGHFFEGLWVAGQQHGKGKEGTVGKDDSIVEVTYEKGKRLPA